MYAGHIKCATNVPFSFQFLCAFFVCFCSMLTDDRSFFFLVRVHPWRNDRLQSWHSEATLFDCGCFFSLVPVTVGKISAL